MQVMLFTQVQSLWNMARSDARNFLQKIIHQAEVRSLKKKQIPCSFQGLTNRGSNLKILSSQIQCRRTFACLTIQDPLSEVNRRIQRGGSCWDTPTLDDSGMYWFCISCHSNIMSRWWDLVKSESGLRSTLFFGCLGLKKNSPNWLFGYRTPKLLVWV